MKYREGLSNREYVKTSAAVIGLAGSLALAAGCSSASTAPKPAAHASVSESCRELIVTTMGTSPKTGTTYELGLYGVWASSTKIAGERFTFIREEPNPHGRDSHTQTPVIKPDQAGALPLVIHTFLPTATLETILVEGEILTDEGRALPGQSRCEVSITVVPVSEFQEPQLPMVPVGTGIM